MSPERRILRFANLGEVMAEVDQLLAGHRTLGSWSLGQICNHLSSGMILSIEGFPGGAPRLVRKTIGPIVGRRLFKSGRMPNGMKIPKEFEPKPGLDARAEAEALRGAIRVFGMHDGPLAEHPLIGTLSKEQWNQFHAIHSAHHLGFVLPESSA